MMTRLALVIGIDDYLGRFPTLDGCVNDANTIAKFLEENEDGKKNYDKVILLTSDLKEITIPVLAQALETVFRSNADELLIYFAGHGDFNEELGSGYLVTQDGTPYYTGIDLNDLLVRANNAYPKIKSTVVILDCCHSGIAGDEKSPNSLKPTAQIGTGVTILTACDRGQTAEESAGHGKFTRHLIEGLSGAASDVLGRVTPASLYAHVDQALGMVGQRPVYKTNVRDFRIVRKVTPRVSLANLRRLGKWFPEPDYVYPLDPTYEKDRGQEAKRLKRIEINPKHYEIYRAFQEMNRNGILVPSQHEHMWHSAIFKGGCKLTELGKHYRFLAVSGEL